MDQRISLITLGVLHLDAQKAFYQDCFGWTPLPQTGGIVFFQLNGLVLGLYPRPALAEDIGIPETGSGFRGQTLAINFDSETAVDAAFAELRGKGVRIIKEPQSVFWGGYSGYVADPEDNFWELAYNPFALPDADGNLYMKG
jgi:hypothetical protein